MYIIENGKGYSINGDKAYKIIFDLDGGMKVDEEDFIEVENQKQISYEEMFKKLNIQYMIEQAKIKKSKKENESEELKQLEAKNEELSRIIEELNEKIKKLELENEELKQQPATEQVNEQVEENNKSFQSNKNKNNKKK